MVDQKFDPVIAHAQVDAFECARCPGVDPREPSLTLDLAAPKYLYEMLRLAPGTAIRTSDRAIPVLVRTEQPILAVLEGDWSAEECDELLELSRDRLKPSTVIDPRTGENTISEYRDSHGMFFRLGETPFVAWLNGRVSEVMNCPVENGEGRPILRYGPDTKTTPHFDFLTPFNATNKESVARSGQRISTMVTKLNDVVAGGETIFPKVGLSVSPKTR
jgi:prolyl 4-hydroxylase